MKIQNIGMANSTKNIVMNTGIDTVCHSTAAVSNRLCRGLDNGANFTPLTDGTFSGAMSFNSLDSALSGLVFTSFVSWFEGLTCLCFNSMAMSSVSVCNGFLIAQSDLRIGNWNYMCDGTNV